VGQRSRVQGGRADVRGGATEPDNHVLSFKCSDEGFAELLEQDGLTPAPYLARAKWVALEHFDALGDKQILARLDEAYRLVFEKLTKKEQAQIGGVAVR